MIKVIECSGVSGVATWGQGGVQSATPDSKKNWQKEGKNDKNWGKKAKIGKVFHFAPPDR